MGVSHTGRGVLKRAKPGGCLQTTDLQVPFSLEKLLALLSLAPINLC
jgi:hypothetical protein